MKKEYAQDLKDKRTKLMTGLDNVNSTIRKRFMLIVSKYSTFMSEDHREFCINSSLHDLDLDTVLDIMIQTEANYVEQTSNQLELTF